MSADGVVLADSSIDRVAEAVVTRLGGGLHRLELWRMQESKWNTRRYTVGMRGGGYCHVSTYDDAIGVSFSWSGTLIEAVTWLMTRWAERAGQSP